LTNLDLFAIEVFQTSDLLSDKFPNIESMMQHPNSARIFEKWNEAGLNSVKIRKLLILMSLYVENLNKKMESKKTKYVERELKVT
jgi:hypothetical protein